MKKQVFIFLLLTLLGQSHQAKADGFYFKPYVGANYDYAHLNYKDGGDQLAEDNLNGGDIHVGARIHKYLGFEGSYLWTADGRKSDVLGSGINTSVSATGFALDAMGYLPVMDKLELIATAGVSRLTEHAKSSGALVLSSTESETKGRIGAGAQYWLTDNLNARGIVRYQGADFSGDLSSAVIATIGLNWQF